MKTYEHNEGYLRLKIDGKLVLHHRYIMEQHLGRKLLKTEVIHHINHNRTDNRLENLQLLTSNEHLKLHGQEKYRKMINLNCAYCGKEFIRELRIHKTRFKHGYNHSFCGRSCQGKRIGFQSK